jgi:2-methylisocitrate lyase-like PEP mutase family enzyme
VATSAEKAELFRALHHGPDVLVLPNAWDCVSARIFEEAGFPAIATTSAGIANAMGYPDGQRIPREEMLAVVKRIAGCVTVPVTADLEGGYDDIAGTIARLLETGAIGLNLEDAERDPAQHAQTIATARRAAHDLEVNVVINARTDIYLAGVGDPASRFKRACERSNAYAAAGADCVFIPAVKDEETIRRFVEALHFPLNFLAVPGSPPVQRLKELGVARVSVGSGIARAAMALTRRIALEVKTTGSFDGLAQAFPYDEANQLFSAGSARHPLPAPAQ